MQIVCYCHSALFYLWHHHTSRFYNRSWHTMCDIWSGWTMINGCNFLLIVASNVLWCKHVSPIYWTFSHLKLQRFTFTRILWIVCCCQLVVFYLWCHHMLGFCNLSCNTMCEVSIGWTMTDGPNLHLIVASNALWHAHVLPIYWTFSPLKLQRFTFNHILWIVCCCHLVLFYLWYHRVLGFATFLVMRCVKLGLDE